MSTGFEQAVNSRNRNLIILEYGDVVYRYVRHTDMVNFNRAPSLKESAIGSHSPVPFEYENEHTWIIIYNMRIIITGGTGFLGKRLSRKLK